MTKRIVLVDGYNLIKNDPALSVIEVRSLEAGRRALISRLLTTFNLQANDVTVVFDGSNVPLPAPSSERHGQVRVIFSRQGETADTVIKRLAAAAPPDRQVVLLSDDRELRSAVQARGAIVGGAAQRARPRATPVTWRKDDPAGNDSAPRRQEKKGNPRRAKKRDRRPPAVQW
jgi:predicted RNA-binding protein with PIN domain